MVRERARSRDASADRQTEGRRFLNLRESVAESGGQTFWTKVWTEDGNARRTFGRYAGNCVGRENTEASEASNIKTIDY